MARIRKWDEYQTYRKDRGTPPWIKVYRRLLNDAEWVQLTDAEKGQLVSIWMLAADKHGEIPDDPKLIQKICHLDSPPDMAKFHKLQFIMGVMPTKNSIHVRTEVETEAERDTETDKKHTVELKVRPSLKNKGDVRDVFEYWQTQHGKQRSKLDANRHGKIERALREYSISDLKHAIDGCLKSDFNMGRDPRSKGRKHNDIELICRDAKHIEGFMELYDAPVATNSHSNFNEKNYEGGWDG